MKIKKFIKNKFIRNYVKFFYYFYFFNLKKKINKVLSFDEKNMGLRINEPQEEQAMPGFKKYIKSGWFKYMLGRYLFSLKYVKNKDVLDAGCGFGWGSYLISDYPKKILSIDIDQKSLDFAKRNWKNSNLNFKRHSVLQLKFLEEKFDVVLSYEVIEHLKYKDGKRYISQISGALKNKGILIMSSYFPGADNKPKKVNKYHLHIYKRDEIKKMLLGNKFETIKFLGNFMVIAKK